MGRSRTRLVGQGELPRALAGRETSPCRHSGMPFHLTMAPTRARGGHQVSRRPGDPVRTEPVRDRCSAMGVVGCRVESLRRRTPGAIRGHREAHGAVREHGIWSNGLEYVQVRAASNTQTSRATDSRNRWLGGSNGTSDTRGALVMKARCDPGSGRHDYREARADEQRARSTCQDLPRGRARPR